MFPARTPMPDPTWDVPIVAPTLLQPVARSAAAALGIADIPLPGSKAFAKRIPPGAPDPVSIQVAEDGEIRLVPESTNGHVATMAPVQPAQRLVISFGPKQGKLVLAVETAPDWDIEQSFVVPTEAVKAMLPILKAMTKIRDMTGGAAFMEDDDEPEERAPARRESAPASSTTRKGKGRGVNRAEAAF